MIVFPGSYFIRFPKREPPLARKNPIRSQLKPGTSNAVLIQEVNLKSTFIVLSACRSNEIFSSLEAVFFVLPWHNQKDLYLANAATFRLK